MIPAEFPGAELYAVKSWLAEGQAPAVELAVVVGVTGFEIALASQSGSVMGFRSALATHAPVFSSVR